MPAVQPDTLYRIPRLFSGLVNLTILLDDSQEFFHLFHYYSQPELLLTVPCTLLQGIRPVK